MNNKYNNQERSSSRNRGGLRENRAEGKKNFHPNKKKYHNEKPQSDLKKLGFNKNPMGFLVISMFVSGDVSLTNISDAISSILESENKKKLVISFDKNIDKQIISNIKRKFENAFGVFFFNPKAKLTNNKTINSSIIHTEVLNSFKSQFFLTLDASIIMKEFAIEKMINFLCKDGETLAIAPKFYNQDGSIVYNCRRFFRMNDFFTKNIEKQKEHFMLERGDIGYYSIHRVDYSSLDCLLFVTDALMKIGKFPTSFKEQDVRDASLCNKFYKKTKGKIIFYPHARVVKTIKEVEENISFMSKIKYILKNRLSFKNV